ncbi:MAG: GTPase Era [Spirochaetales bacterium]|nr:GTPase Era [Spirochaetales bacterium]
MKSAFVAIIGRPSTGKSTLINQFCGGKVSIISRTPQTTRNKIRGIYTSQDLSTQLIFIDTPGFHNSDKKLNNYLKDLVHTSIEEAEILLYVLDTARPPGQEEHTIINMLKKSDKPVLIALNKIDLPAKLRKLTKEEISQLYPEVPVFEISALEDKGITELLEALIKTSPEGDQYYPDDYYTDQTPEFRIAEIIREKAINLTSQELPHSIYVELADMEMREEENLLWVRGFIYVERESQKGILVGKAGAKIKNIIHQSTEECKDIFPYDVQLDIRVKVKPKWRKNDSLLSRLLK